MWSMPRSVLRIVAGIIALCAVAGFVMGVRAVPEKGRLPGEPVQGATAEAINAAEAKPLTDESLPPPPPPEEKKPIDDKKVEVDPNDAVRPGPTSNPVAPPAVKPSPAEDKVGDLLDGVTPAPPEDPPH